MKSSIYSSTLYQPFQLVPPRWYLSKWISWYSPLSHHWSHESSPRVGKQGQSEVGASFSTNWNKIHLKTLFIGVIQLTRPCPLLNVRICLFIKGNTKSRSATVSPSSTALWRAPNFFDAAAGPSSKNPFSALSNYSSGVSGSPRLLRASMVASSTRRGPTNFSKIAPISVGVDGMVPLSRWISFIGWSWGGGDCTSDWALLASSHL